MNAQIPTQSSLPLPASVTGKPAKNPGSFFASMIDQFGTPENVVQELVKRCNDKPVDARLDLQVFLNVLGREEESFAISKQLIEIAPQDPRVLFNHGWHWLKRNQLRTGLALLEYGRGLKNYGNDALPSNYSLWAPETGRGQRMILSLEGGFGDEIIHFRFVKNLVETYGCKVTLICSPGIASLFARDPNVAALAQKEAAPGILHESWLPGMSAALALGLEYKDLSDEPYMSADPKKVKQWESLIQARAEQKPNGQKLKVGIRWAGRPAFEHQQLRLFPPQILTDLQNNSGVQLYSFQRDDNLIDLPEGIVDLGPHLKDWDDTAAAIENMDLMISSCTSVAHLSAAMGKKTWILVPALPYFTWAIPGDKSPWYKTATLFRQKSFGDWTSVKEELHQKFKEMLSE